MTQSISFRSKLASYRLDQRRELIQYTQPPTPESLPGGVVQGLSAEVRGAKEEGTIQWDNVS